MADLKISQLTAITVLTPATDVLPVVDSGGTTKKITTNQILGSGGTATLASATITGALAANADTTIGTASKSTNTNLNFSSDLGTQRIYIDRGTRSLVFQDVTSSIENYRIAGITGVHTWGVGGSTAMTLNSAGLGVGGSPANFANYTTIHAIGKTTTAGGVFQTSTSNNSTAARFACSSTSVDLFVETSHPINFYTNAINRMTLDDSGNLILLSPSTPPTLATNGQLTVNATSNTNLRFSYRGSDGTTRVANITLA